MPMYVHTAVFNFQDQGDYLYTKEESIALGCEKAGKEVLGDWYAGIKATEAQKDQIVDLGLIYSRDYYMEKTGNITAFKVDKQYFTKLEDSGYPLVENFDMFIHTTYFYYTYNKPYPEDQYGRKIRNEGAEILMEFKYDTIYGKPVRIRVKFFAYTDYEISKMFSSADLMFTINEIIGADNFMNFELGRRKTSSIENYVNLSLHKGGQVITKQWSWPSFVPFDAPGRMTTLVHGLEAALKYDIKDNPPICHYEGYGKGFYYYDNTWKKLSVFDASVPVPGKSIPHAWIKKLDSETFRLTIG